VWVECVSVWVWVWVECVSLSVMIHTCQLGGVAPEELQLASFDYFF
jgi:hypothetical protein